MSVQVMAFNLTLMAMILLINILVVYWAIQGDSKYL